MPDPDNRLPPARPSQPKGSQRAGLAGFLVPDLPGRPSAPDAKHNALKSKLEGLKGAAFDRAYIDAMLADHRTTIAAFQAEASAGTDPDLKAYAAKTLPTLEEHLKLAEAAAAAVKRSSGS